MTNDKTRPFAGQMAWLSGGSSGITLAIAHALGRSGATIAIQGRDQDRLDQAVSGLVDAGIVATGYAADVRDAEATAQRIDAFVAEHGQLDMVVAGAAGNFVAPADKISANGFETVVDIDLLGTFNLFRAAIETIAPDSAARFLAISAPQGSIPYPFQAHVNAAKAGIDQLVRSLALEWGPRGVRVNAISPGPIAGTEGMRRLSPTKAAHDRLESMIPLRRYGQLDDISRLAHFLMSPDADYMTGQIIGCDGGLSLMGAAVYAEGLA